MNKHHKWLPMVLMSSLILLICVFSVEDALSKNSDATVSTTTVYLPLVSKPGIWSQVDPSGMEIEFWYSYGGDFMLDLVNQFNTTNPWDISVKALGIVEIYEILSLLSITGEEVTADLVTLAPQYVADLQSEFEIFTDLRSFINDNTWGIVDDWTDFFPGPLDQGSYPTFGDARLGFATSSHGEVMYTNTDWLVELGYSSPPTSPEEFKEMACAAAATPYSDPIGDDHMGYILFVDASRFTDWIFAFGGEIFDIQTGQYTLNSPAAVNAMTFLVDLKNSGCMLSTTNSSYEKTEFSQGNLLFAISSSYNIPAYITAVEAGAQFNWNLSAMANDLSSPVINTYSTSISILKNSAEEELAAWLFLKYMTSPETQADLTATTNALPVRESAGDYLTSYFSANPYHATAFELMPYTKAEYAIPNYLDVRGWIKDALSDILAGQDIQYTLDQLNIAANGTLP